MEDLSLSTTEDTPLTINVPITAVDVSAVTLTVETLPSHGTVTGKGPTWTYTPAANYNGDDGLVVRAEDIRGTSTASVTIHVTAVDDAPVANPDSLAGAFETPLTIPPSMLLDNDTDIDSTVLTVTGVADATHGTVAMSGGQIIFTPEVGFTGSATFTYTASDGTLTTHATVTVTLDPDRPPVAVADSVATDEEVTLLISDASLLANDADPEPQTLGITAVAAIEGSTHGTVSHSGTTITYVPDPNYNGPASFSYTVSDGYLTDVGTVTVTVNAIDDPPVAVNDSPSVQEDSGATAIDVLANDTDIDGGPISITTVTQPSHGTVLITGGGTGLTYAPGTNYCNHAPPVGVQIGPLAPAGPDTFTYTLFPGGSTATVSVTVFCVDDPPVAVDDSTTVAEDSGANAINVLDNDTDVDGGPKSIATITQPSHGTAVITGGGTGVTYTPNADYCNSAPPSLGITPQSSLFDSFTYTLSPGGNTATVTVTVTCADDAPVAVDDTASITEDSGANAIDVLANDTDVDSGPKSIATVTQPSHGTVLITGGGTGLTYSPGTNYCNHAPPSLGAPIGPQAPAGPDTFTYTLLPGGSTATVSVTVFCVDDAPVAVNDLPTVAEDSIDNSLNVLLNDTDVDGGPRSVESITQPANGNVAIGPSGLSVTYTPDTDYCNQYPNVPRDTFTYTVTPGGSTATVSVAVLCACGKNKTTDFIVGSSN